MSSYQFNRENSRDLQSPKGIYKGEPTAFKQQLKPVIDALERDGELTEPVKGFLMQGDGEQIHHINPLRSLAPLFDNTTETQRQMLQEIMPTGHNVFNFMNLPQRAHQGQKDDYSTLSVHNLNRERGLEQGAAADKLHPVLQRINQSANASFPEKLQLMTAYVDEVYPLMRENIDSALQDYESKMDQLLVDVRNDPKRKAGDIYLAGDDVIINRYN